MSPTNLANPFYEEGDELTGYCTAAVTGMTFVKISGPRQPGGPNLVNSAITDSVVGGNVSIAPCVSGDKVLGVAMYDQALGNLVPVFRHPKVMPVTAGAAIVAGQEVQADANGNAIPVAAGKAAGLALDSCASGGIAQVSLYP
ncbi:MAG TPA: capsid cement protein [Scandinavium sp.]|jgi:hypothetical protein|uniref:capsid cement protein n=1 Tax=Scandinavium sp. TaxID=2830653 RepID=UPI002E348909|nr:capsid cement protein [Scandinavium sp.]HEX4501100.1 capsid cement protein [Scandinavium sp.]